MGHPQAAKVGAQKAKGAAEAQAQAAATATAAGGRDDTCMAQLQKLTELHTMGVLSDEEFTATKDKVLGMSTHNTIFHDITKNFQGESCLLLHGI
ncbi:MAG: SHOCT domain-containing protein [Methanomicrobiales archaeon]|nr:SHOCT domain-containing protein [Methanomicrobiales archaeon]